MRRFLFFCSVFLLVICHRISAQWSPLCGATTNGFVVDFAEYDGLIHATGFFKKICGNNANYLAKWNGADWQQAGIGSIAEGHALEVIDGVLHIATYEFGTDSNWVLRWNGTTLSKLGDGVYRTNPNPGQSKTASIYDIIQYNGQVVACGEFNRAGGKNISGIMRWTGTTWDSLGGGLSGNIPNTPPVIYPHQMLLFNGDLIVVGNFQKAGGQVVNGIARWDGQDWYAMGGGFNSTVYGAGVFNGELYTGGDFTKSGSTPLGRIARWDGMSWVNPGLDFSYADPNGYAFVHTIRQIGDSLFICGGFDLLTDDTGNVLDVSGIVALDNTGNINTMGGGIPGVEIEAVIGYNGSVIVGGGVFGGGYTGIWNATTATFEPFHPQDVHITPNPASTGFSLSGSMAHRFAEVEIYDTCGRLLQQNIFPDVEETDISGLPNGVYWVVLHSRDKLPPVQQKLVVFR